MNPCFLLVDFGATHTKAILVNMVNGKFVHSHVFPTLKNCSINKNHYEIPANSIQSQFRDICHFYHDKLQCRFDGIFLCSQMHGFLLVDEKNQPLTEYISWQDERSLQKINDISSFSLVQDNLSATFKNITGMHARPGFPFSNVLHVLREKKISSQSIKVISLPEWIVLQFEDAKPLVHQTMIAGSGFFNIKNLSVSSELIEFIKQETGYSLIFNQPVNENEIVAHVSLDNKKIPIYVAVGDHACALLGAENHFDTISINMGTGSQVSLVNAWTENALFGQRPFFQGDYLLTQTHIPAGRALNEYMGFIDSLGKSLDVSFNAWSLLKQINLDDLQQATLEIDLAIFKSAVNYCDGGKITHIHEGQFTVKNYLASLLKNLLLQYVHFLEKIDTQHRQVCVLSGGIPRELPVLADFLATVIKMKIKRAAAIDETLLGLRTLGVMAMNEASHYRDAILRFQYQS